jgi:hypothetical protein
MNADGCDGGGGFGTCKSFLDVLGTEEFRVEGA